MFPPHLDPQTYALSATIVGALIAPDLTINEANSIGNWLVLVGDYLLAFAGQKALIQSQQNNNQNLNNQINSIIMALQRMQEELEKLKKEKSQ